MNKPRRPNKWFLILSLLIAVGVLAKVGVGRYSTQALIKEMKEPDIHLVQHWLKFGANPNAVNHEGEPVLLLAITGTEDWVIVESHRIDYDVVKVLLDYGADPNTQVGIVQATPLMMASALGQPDIVELLIKRGAKVNARTSKADGSCTALTMARRNLKLPKKRNWERVERILLSAGAKT